MDKEKPMYMIVTNDEYELPLVVDRSLEGLAKFTGKTNRSLSSTISRTGVFIDRRYKAIRINC